METVYLLALGSNLCFSLGGQAYTFFSRKISPVWMNTHKAMVASIAFLVTALALGHFSIPSLSALSYLLLSGALGLGLGDIFLLQSFKQIGIGRTMMLFSFQPLVVGLLSYFFLAQTMDWNKTWSILFFILCVFIISIESFKAQGKWHVSGILMALAGLTLDALGILITRSVFDHNLEIHPLTSNFYRTIGALLFFFILNFFKPIGPIKHFLSLNKKEKILAMLAPLLGTYLSLGLFLMAVQTGSLATISGIAITGTIFSTLFECVIQKKYPSKYFYLSFIFFLIGMKFLLF